MSQALQEDNDVGGWGQPGTAGASFAAELRFDGISHFYGTTQALEDVSLEVGPGEVAALLGASGSGKSTLLRIAAGLERQSRGCLYLDRKLMGGPGAFVAPEERGVGLVFQDFALFPHMSVLQNVMFGLARQPRALARQAAFRALERVGMLRHAEKYPHMLSGGEQQRVALARAIAPRPRVILMDEPFSGLDSRLRDRVRAETLSLLKETGATSILVTHDAEEAMMMADRIALLSKGRLVAHGTPEELFQRPQSLECARFFTPMNEIPGKVEDGHVNTPFGRIPAPGMEEGGRAVVCVRHTGVRIAEGERRGGVPARVVRRRFLGEHILVELAVTCLNSHLHAKVRAGRRIGSDVTIYLDPRDVLTFAY